MRRVLPQSRWLARIAGPAREDRHEIASHVALVANVIGIADAAGAVSNTEFMLLSVFN